MSKFRNSANTPKQRSGLEPPIKLGGQKGMAPALDENEKPTPIGDFEGRADGLSDHERNEWISKRAYALWEQAGRPEGHDADHWEQAISDFDERGDLSDRERREDL